MAFDRAGALRRRHQRLLLQGEPVQVPPHPRHSLLCGAGAAPVHRVVLQTRHLRRLIECHGRRGDLNRHTASTCSGPRRPQ